MKIIYRAGRRLFGLALFICVLALAVPASAEENNLTSFNTGLAFSEYFMNVSVNASSGGAPSAVGLDSAYIVGPGDVLDILVWGKLQALYTVEVSWDGSLMPMADSRANVEDFLSFWPGSVSVDKRSLADIQKMINKSFAQYLKDDVRVSVKVARPRSIRVQLLGQLVKPHEYNFEAGTTLVKAISVAGYTPQTSLRRIRLVRRGTMGAKGAGLTVESTTVIDLYRFFVDYDLDANVVLQNGDVIEVPIVQTTASSSGGVNVPALYEILPGETLSDLVRSL